MKFGNTTVDLVSDGTFLLDGGIVFGQVAKETWELYMKPDRKNRVRMGLNCLMIQTPSMNILVDTGAGNKRVEKFRGMYGLTGNKLINGLKGLGLNAREIDTVLLTHMHFDHAGGCTKLDRSGNSVPTFANATYMVQRDCWEDANNPDERNQGLYYPDDFLPLEESDSLKLLEGDSEIVPGVRTLVTNGHSKGHQIVLIETGSERIAYLGDLVPTQYHLALPSIGAFDYSPNDTLLQKRNVFKMAIDGGWLLVFGHSHGVGAGYIEERNGRVQFQPVDF